MADPRTKVAVVAGDGAVIRRDSIVVVLGAPVLPALVDQIDNILDSTDGAGRVRAVARLLLDDHVEAGGAVLAVGEVADVFAVGPFDLVVADGRVRAAQHILGLSEQVDLADLVALIPAGTDVPTVPGWADLAQGATVGVGVVFGDRPPISEPEQSDEDGTQPTGQVPASGRFELVSLTADIDLSDREPLPVEPDTVTDLDFDLPPYMRPVTVTGVLSSRGFLNHPDAVICSRSGVELDDRARGALVEGPRPPLGVLSFDDGATCSVQWNLVIGRDPRGDDRVTAGSAAPYPITDTELRISRRHLLVDLVDWAVFIEDLDTANGTFVREGSGAPRRLEPGERYQLRTGCTVLLGDRSFVYDEHHVQ
ncbi:MAG: FHA domain-containing protein [Acidimicrobiales bacterium]